MKNYNKIKNFWIEKIKKLIAEAKPSEDYYYYAEIKDSWENDLMNKEVLADISEKVLVTCRVIYNANSWLGGYSGLKFFQLLDKLKVKEEYFWLINETAEDYKKDLTNLQTELNSYKSTWDGHHCPSPGSCSHTDYNDLKSERDRLKNELTELKNDTTNQQLIKKIIADSNLDIDQNSSLEQLITKIKALIKDPDDNKERKREQLQTAISNLKQEKTDLETQINQKNQAIADLQKPNNQTIEEVKEKIRKKAKEMKINATQLEKMLENAQSYQQLVDLEQKFLPKD